jgi:hypothetical protein
VTRKRRLDETFHCAAPSFSQAALDAHERLMDLSFTTFGRWGQDARGGSQVHRTDYATR